MLHHIRLAFGWNRVFLCSPSCFQTPDPSASVLGLQVCTITPGWFSNFLTTDMKLPTGFQELEKSVRLEISSFRALHYFHVAPHSILLSVSPGLWSLWIRLPEKESRFRVDKGQSYSTIYIDFQVKQFILIFFKAFPMSGPGPHLHLLWLFWVSKLLQSLCSHKVVLFFFFFGSNRVQTQGLTLAR
jgi:hypothetical protein